MPANHDPRVLRAGQIVLAVWPADTLPKEPNTLRPAVVVGDDGLFVPNYPNAILVPLTEDATFAIPELSVPIEPTVENGCGKPCRAVSHMVAATSKVRIRPTPSRVILDQLHRIRRQIATALGLGE
jgi:mRNA interferase MazF